MRNQYDIAVIGLGAMGSAAVCHLAKRGLTVLGLDRFQPPHTFGSSHGQSRIIREAYFEHPSYVPLVQRAYQLWKELEAESGRSLYVQTGGLMIGTPDGELVTGATKSAEIHKLSYNKLSGNEVHNKYPAFHTNKNTVAIWEPRAGVLFPEACLEAHLEQAARNGADLRYREPLCEWHVGDGVKLITEKGIYRAEQVIFSAGAWVSELLADLKLPLWVARQTLFWFQPQANPQDFSPEKFPIFIWEHEHNRYFYGFPNLGQGLKVAIHHEGERATADCVNREVQPQEVAGMRDLLNRFLPDAAGPLLSTAVCLYTNTPDYHFLIDRHPQYERVWIASPCSGHGFKFSSAIGEVLADLAITGKSALHLDLFKINRFSPFDRAG
ncbi:N-methyl-L-tryptophan oxidase [Candidatus Acetothermia bacterium]|nr:N-methyl-L-tryptophan oxidase [Candidatus Acetothermia bacterium]MBI3643114.1 N-methyl-L-tryptophan oxidase [Candidatus Acetothermia bacterium]